MQQTATEMTRRTFLRGAIASAGALGAGATSAASAARKGTVTRYPLRIPPTSAPANLGLTAALGVADLGGGKTSSVLAYNAWLPGPTLRANRGDLASIQFTNGLADETTVHWHGMIVRQCSAEPWRSDDVMRRSRGWWYATMARLAGVSPVGRAGLIRPESVARAIVGLATGRRRAPSGAAVDVLG